MSARSERIDVSVDDQAKNPILRLRHLVLRRATLCQLRTRAAQGTVHCNGCRIQDFGYLDRLHRQDVTKNEHGPLAR